MNNSYYSHPKLIKVELEKNNHCTSLKEPYHFAIIIPYRDQIQQKRKEQLEYFIPFITDYLKGLGESYHFHIIVVEQSEDGRKFNRGKLLNVGFCIAQKKGCKYCIFHDVDLIPDNTLRSYYGFYPYQPLHLAAVWEKYQHLPVFFGGVCAFNCDHFRAVNGFPNDFWGWGCEDEELYYRIGESGMDILQPTCGQFIEQAHLASKTIPNLVNLERDELLAETRMKPAESNGLSTLKTTKIFPSKSLNDYTEQYLVVL